MNELKELDEAADEFKRAWKGARILGWIGSSTTCAYVSQEDYDRMLYAGQRLSEARAAAERRAFI